MSVLRTLTQWQGRRFLLTLACLLIPTLLFYEGEGGLLGWIWFFMAVGVGLVIGQRWALLLAPLPFLLGANLGRIVGGLQSPGFELYPGYEFGVTLWITTIMGLVGIGIGLGLHKWIKSERSWRRIGVTSVVLMALVGVWSYGLYREAHPPPMRCYIHPAEPDSTLCTRGDVPEGYVEVPAEGEPGSPIHPAP